jgi:hypothetical protein
LDRGLDQGHGDSESRFSEKIADTYAWHFGGKEMVFTMRLKLVVTVLFILTAGFLSEASHTSGKRLRAGLCKAKSGGAIEKADQYLKPIEPKFLELDPLIQEIKELTKMEADERIAASESAPYFRIGAIERFRPACFSTTSGART